MQFNNYKAMKNIITQPIGNSDAGLTEPMFNTLFVVLIFQSFIETLNLDLSLSTILFQVFIISLISFVFGVFRVRANVTLGCLFFATLIVGTMKALDIFSLPSLSQEAFNIPLYSFLLSLSFLIIINNINKKYFPQIIVYNLLLALLISTSALFDKVGLNFPAKFYNYIPILFLVLNTIIYAFRDKPE
jgi:hypothetical protein